MRERITSAHILALIAIILAVGGNAIAFTLGKNSVGTKQLKKNAVTTKKIKKEAVTAAKVKKGTLTGTQIDASTLGMVPSAQTAQTAITVAPPEPWHEVSTFETCSIGPTVSWEVAGGALETPAYFRDPFGVVHLRGSVKCPASSAYDYSIFTLPPGFRPERYVYFPAVNGYNREGALAVGKPGKVQNMRISNDAASHISLDSVSFRCGPSGVDGCP